MRVAWLKDLRMTDLEQVGGKNASLGEMIGGLAAAGIRVPGGFATTAEAFREFLGDLGPRIDERLRSLDPNDVKALAKCGAEIRSWILEAAVSRRRSSKRYALSIKLLQKHTSSETSFAVRSSATAEDLPEASFAGQQETFLNIRGIDNVLEAIRHVFASLYNDRAISYRAHQGFDHAVGRAVGGRPADGAQRPRRGRGDVHAGYRIGLPRRGVHHLVLRPGRAAGAGRGQPGRVLRPQADAGEGPPGDRAPRAWARSWRRWCSASRTRPASRPRTVDVPEAERNAFSLTDAEVLELARYAVAIERHYGRPMDIEWGKDGADGRIYVLQARPETVKSRTRDVEERYALKGSSRSLVSGRAIGHKIGSGAVRVVKDASQMDKVKKGDVLVTDMTDPNWEPVMKLAAAIVTNRGGRTCHAAIIARELGIPAVVGCGDATAQAQGRPGGHRVLRRGRHRQRLRGPAAVRGVEPRARRDAAHPGQDRDERRQPASSPSSSRSCRTPASASRASSSSSTTRSACTRAPASSTRTCPRT